ncbi:MAG: GNAT family N-acetyltransferase [Bacteroidetes bacterium]|nr:GNAT family N-acetyltransferase [Bacteroidota bacterium]
MIAVTREFAIRSLGLEDLDTMYKAFKNAFSDYPIHFKLTREHFRKKFVDNLDINFPFSAGAFYSETLVGFIFTSISLYEGKKTAYNGGTGVIPEFRGNGLVQKMFQYLLPMFKESEFQQCILEVLINNHAAIKAYKKLGFVKTRDYKCFKLNPLNFTVGAVSTDIIIRQITDPDWDRFLKYLDYAPSYLDSLEMIKKNIKNETILEAIFSGQPAGYAIYQPATGRINYIAVEKSFRNRGIGKAFIRYIYHHSHTKLLTIINVDRKSESMLIFLLNIGFENQFDQYEMRLII